MGMKKGAKKVEAKVEKPEEPEQTAPQPEEEPQLEDVHGEPENEAPSEKPAQYKDSEGNTIFNTDFGSFKANPTGHLYTLEGDAATPDQLTKLQAWMTEQAGGS